MIQAPQTQYIPQQPMMLPMGYQQQGVNQAIQYPQQQTPGYYYNYPTTSCYSQPATAKSQYNGVNIEILNPQGQGVAPQNACAMPAQYMPIQQAPVMMPAYPQFPASQAIVQAPAMPQATPVEVAPQPQAAAPVAVPQPQIETPVVAAQPQQVAPQPQVETPVVAAQPQQVASQPQTVEAQPAQPQQVAQEAPVVAAPVVEEPAVQTPTISPESFAGRLNSDDVDVQSAAIEEVAELVKNNEAAGPILLDTQIFDALVGIMNKDTSNLESPSPEVLALRQKPLEELSEDDRKKATTPSQQEKAEINKQHAIYTIAYMQSCLNNELEKRNGQALELKDLPCIENIVDTVKTNNNPLLRISAIAALAHIARPEYKEDLTQIFELAKADADPGVQEIATKAIGNLK